MSGTGIRTLMKPVQAMETRSGYLKKPMKREMRPPQWHILL